MPLYSEEERMYKNLYSTIINSLSIKKCHRINIKACIIIRIDDSNKLSYFIAKIGFLVLYLTGKRIRKIIISRISTQVT